MSQVLPLHKELYEGTRLRGLMLTEPRVNFAEIMLLMGCGALAAVLSVLLDFHMKMPGNAILRITVPMTFGLALVPRRGGGTIMGASAFGTGLLLPLLRFPGGGLGLGFGVMTALFVTGPIFDAALWKVRRGWRLYVAFAASGLVVNFFAFSVRAVTKTFGLGGIAAQPLVLWLPRAIPSYIICGIVAGLMAAGASALLFRPSESENQDAARGTPNE
jgi:hypothetical protein